MKNYAGLRNEHRLSADNAMKEVLISMAQATYREAR